MGAIRPATVMERRSREQSILNFVTAVTREGSADFIPVSQRIATFDNDGTLWCEQPMYVQLRRPFHGSGTPIILCPSDTRTL